MNDNNGNGWNEWAKHVLTELDRLLDSNEHLRDALEAFKLEIAKELARKTELEALQRSLNEHSVKRVEDLSNVQSAIAQAGAKAQEELSNLKQDHGKQLAELQLKAGLWGALAGMVPGVLALVIYLLTKGTGG